MGRAAQHHGFPMNPLLWLFETLVNLYIWIIVGQAVLSILISFQVVNARQPFVQAVGEFLYRATEPALAPIRRRLPNLGPIDVSPILLIIGLMFVVQVVRYLFRMM
jgi:YggT family protein